MFVLLLWFEIKNRLMRPSSFCHFVVFFTFSFLLAILFAGAFKGANFSFGLSHKLPLNSPVVISYIVGSMSYFGILIIAALFGESVNQDFETQFHPILFSTPVRKSTYFLVRFLGSFISTLAIFFSIGLGVWVATLMPFIDSSMLQENHLRFYCSPYLTQLIPNILTFGAIFFAVVAYFKKMGPVHLASISIFTAYMIAAPLTGDLDNRLIASLLDPFGMEGVHQVIRYWSVTEQSAQTIPLEGYFFYNRLLWVAIGFVFLALSYLLFNPYRLPINRKILPESPLQENETKEADPLYRLSPRSWKILWQLSLAEVKQVCSNYSLWLLLGCGIVYIFAISGEMGKIFGTETWPVTYRVLEIVDLSFSIFVTTILVYFAAEMVWKNREQRVFELVDSKSVPDLFLYFSKFAALCFIQLLLMATIWICCLVIQISQGYTHFEIGVYAQYLLLYTLPAWMYTAIFVFFIQILVCNKYVGHAIAIGNFVLLSWLPEFGLNHRLYLIGNLPKPLYSDMNGFGTLAKPFLLFTSYWGAFHILLVLLSLLLWKRGEILSGKERWKGLQLKSRPVYASLISTSLCAWAFLGGVIFYNTNLLNTYKTQGGQTRDCVEYEVNYKRFEKMGHPDLTSVDIHLDLFPEIQSLSSTGCFKYQNRTKNPIQTILVRVPEKSERAELHWSRPARLAEHNPKSGVRIYEFEQPLLPGHELLLDFSLSIQPQGIENGSPSYLIVENGTFFQEADIFPTMGYDSRLELSDDRLRSKYGLSERPRMPNIDDQEAIQKTYISQEGTWIDFEATISTSLDQIALAPGTLQKEWQEQGRRYFHYKSESPILPFYAFLSGRYIVARDRWEDIEIEVYHHASHTANIPRMIQAVKKSLTYYTQNFSPYQFKQLRIVEFPRYRIMAQAFAGVVPFSEGLGFIAKVDPNNPEDLDYPFYVTAHEVAHQWWAHQVIGGRVQGATMLSESLAQYSALMVMEKELGPQQMKKFLKYEMDRYLNGRSCEIKQEQPLMLNEDQQYIPYQKGSLAFYALKDAMGETSLNRVLREYIQEVSFQKPPFTRSIELIGRLKLASTPDTQKLIRDLFETITFYDNRTESVSFKPLSPSTFEVEICCFNKKIRADGLGHECEIEMDDLIDVGIYDQEGNLRFLEKRKISSGENRITIEVDFEPSKAGIDPLSKLIDKITDNKILKAERL